MTMKVVELIEEMRHICEALRKEGKRVRLVPTMGALHIGHASLIQSAFQDPNHHDDYYYCRRTNEEEQEENRDGGVSLGNQNYLAATNNNHNSLKDKPFSRLEDSRTKPMNLACPAAQEPQENDVTVEGVVVIVSIFLNPKQFNNPADYANYPNTRSADLEFCKRLKVRYVFAPTLKQFYSTDTCSSFSNTARLKLPIAVASENNYQCMVTPPDSIAHDLEGKSRPGHFKGMLTVVCKLFNVVKPHEAYFGEKDYQQLILVTQMSRELDLNVNIRAVETVRDHDLLPLSSRNVRLSASQRKIAPVMYKILLDAKQTFEELDRAIDDPRICMDTDNKCSNISSVLTASMLTTLCLNTNEYDSQMFDIDYLELRCAKDVSKIHYKQDSNRFDCELGCIERQLENGQNITLKGRILISVVIGKVRLLDNIEVLMNLNQASK